MGVCVRMHVSGELKKSSLYLISHIHTSSNRKGIMDVWQIVFAIVIILVILCATRLFLQELTNVVNGIGKLLSAILRVFCCLPGFGSDVEGDNDSKKPASNDKVSLGTSDVKSTYAESRVVPAVKNGYAPNMSLLSTNVEDVL